MPAFTLYGALGSTNTDRVRLTLAEGGFTDYELVHVNLRKGEQKVGELFHYRTCVPSFRPQTVHHTEPSQLLSTNQLVIPLLAKFDSRTS